MKDVIEHQKSGDLVSILNGAAYSRFESALVAGRWRVGPNGNGVNNLRGALFQYVAYEHLRELYPGMLLLEEEDLRAFVGKVDVRRKFHIASNTPYGFRLKGDRDVSGFGFPDAILVDKIGQDSCEPAYLVEIKMTPLTEKKLSFINLSGQGRRFADLMNSGWGRDFLSEFLKEKTGLCDLRLIPKNFEHMRVGSRFNTRTKESGGYLLVSVPVERSAIYDAVDLAVRNRYSN